MGSSFIMSMKLKSGAQCAILWIFDEGMYISVQAKNKCVRFTDAGEIYKEAG